MLNKRIIIKNQSGLHVRPAGLLVKAVASFDCDVRMEYKEKQYNAKSVLGIMSACIKCGDEVNFICNGADEEKALNAIIALIESGLGE